MTGVTLLMVFSFMNPAPRAHGVLVNNLSHPSRGRELFGIPVTGPQGFLAAFLKLKRMECD
jgi:hypothetical protein